MRDIENRILHGLTKNTDIGLILEDDELILVLDESKLKSDEINENLKVSKKTEEEIDKTCNTFRPVAFRASILFFAIVDLSAIDPMYQYSLQWFTHLFISSVEHSVKSSDPA